MDLQPQTPMLNLRKPYLLFLGGVGSKPYAKTAFGIRDWSPESCLAQLRLPGCGVDLGLPEMMPETAADAGAGSLVIGVASAGGQIPLSWQSVLLRSARVGLDIVSGMHMPLADVPDLAAAASVSNAELVDVRRPTQCFDVATGRRRSGRRLLTVGTDCALGKKYTALALARALQARGVAADFRATGQTGIMIEGSGVALDAVVADFVAGAAEWLTPDAEADHWDVIEGQGSLFHPAYAGVTVALTHGSQPDVLVLCHDPMRKHIESCPGYPVPSLPDAARRYLELASLTNPAVSLGGVSLNTSMLDGAARDALIRQVESDMEVPCFDPLLTSLDGVIERVLAS